MTRTVFSPDGKRLATVQRGNQPSGAALYVLQVWDAATGKEVATIYKGNGDPKYPVFSPDGKRLAAILPTGMGTQKAIVWPAAGGEAQAEFPKGESPGERLFHFSRDGKVLLAAGEKVIYKVDATGWTVDVVAGIEVSRDCRYALSPTADTLFVLYINLGFVILDPITGKRVRVSRVVPEKLNAETTVVDVRYSGDGETLFFAQPRTILRIETKTWAVLPPLRREQGVGVAGRTYQTSPSHDGKRVVAMGTVAGKKDSQRIHVWTDATEQVLPFEDVYTALLSPDGRTVVATTATGGFLVIDVDSGKPKVFAD